MIGILGGTFDPPHWGHIKLAENFIRQFKLDELIWLPAGQPWQKNSQITPSIFRYQLTLAAAEDLKSLLANELNTKINVSKMELDRQGPSYTIDTVKELRRTYGPNESIIWLMGSDSYQNLPTWHHWEDLPKYVHLAIASRPVGTFKNNLSSQEVLKKLEPFICINPNELANSAAGKVYFDMNFCVELSSTELRSQLQTNQSDQELLKSVPPRVLEIIHSLGIYTSKPGL